MKIYNSILTKNDLSRFDDAHDAIRILKSLGYDLCALLEDDELAPSNQIRSWSTKENTWFRCLFLQMPVVTEQTLYPIFSTCITQKPLNLVWITSDYRYVFIAALKRAQPNYSSSENASMYPSTLIRRLDMENLTSLDYAFLEELTRTLDSDQAQFAKILHAFNQIEHNDKTKNPDFAIKLDESLIDNYYHLRRTLQTNKDIVYSGSWNEKYKLLILPVLKYFGYSPLPIDLVNQPPDTHSASLLYDLNSKMIPPKPTAYCICTDAVLDELFSSTSLENAPETFNSSDIKKIIVTDGRIWAVHSLIKSQPDTDYFDLYRLLKLDYTTSAQSLNDFEVFQRRFAEETAPPASIDIVAPDDVWNTARITTINCAVELFKPLAQHETDCYKKAQLFLFKLFYLLFSELSGRMTPTDDLRWNIPELHQIAFSPEPENSTKNAEWIKAHLIACLNMDISRNICAGIFSEQMPPLRNYIYTLDPKRLLDCVIQAGSLWKLFFGERQFVHKNSSELFVRFLESVFVSDSNTEISDSANKNLTHKIVTRLEQVLKNSVSLPDQNDPTGSRHCRKNLEQALQFHIIDPNPHLGFRLVQALNIFITNFKKAWGDKHHQALTDFLQTIRLRLIQDSHEHGLFLDLRTLTDMRLLRLKCIQHCLYGLLDTDISHLAPANLFLTTDLSGIRFPWVAHHFHQNADGALQKLDRDQKSEYQPPPTTDSLAGIVTAARWFASCEQDFQICGPDFEFTRRLYRELKKQTDQIVHHYENNKTMPVEWAFPWLFHARLSGELDVAIFSLD